MKKKGFTLVELLVVIAILAILATIGVVTYTSFMKDATISNDKTIVSQLNLALQGNESLGKKANNADEAINQMYDSGFIVGNLTPTTNDYNIVYDLDRNRFILLDENNDFIFGDDASKKAYDKTKLYNYFKVIHVAEEEASILNILEFAPYLYVENSDQNLVKESWTNSELLISTGFDTGNVSSLKEIKYVNKGESQNVVIRTYGSILTIDGKNDTVSHYGLSCEMNVVDVNNTACLDEYGIVGRFIYKDNNGKVNLKDGSVVFCYMNVSQDSNMDADKITTPNGMIYSHVDSAEAQQAISAGKDVNEIKRDELTLKLGKDGTVSVAKCDGHLDNENYEIFDSKYGTFIICKKCGGYCLYNRGKLYDKSQGISEDNNNLFILTPVTNITLNKSSAEILVGKQITLVADVLPTDATIKSVYWESENTKIATVEDGVVTGKSIGSVIIKAIANDGSGVYAVCVVDVVKQICDHNYVLIDTFAPTCIEEGYQNYKCSKCKHVKKVITADALGHQWETNANNGEQHCTRCDKYFLDNTGTTQIWTDNMFVYSDSDLTSIKRLTHTKANQELQQESNIVNIPTAVTNIEEKAFANCDFIKNVVFTNDVEVADDAFFNCSGISQIEGNNKVIELGNGAFNMFDSTVNTVIKKCIFVVKTGDIGITLETYGAQVTFEDCAFIINNNDENGNKNAVTSGILVEDSSVADKTIIILKNTSVAVKSVAGNKATFIQLYLTEKENVLVKVEDSCGLSFDEGEAYFSIATAGTQNVKCNVYAGTANTAKLQNKGIVYGANVRSDYFKLKTLAEYETDTTVITPGEDGQATAVSTEAEFLKAISDGVESIKLTANIEVSQYVGLKHDLTIDLNSKKLTFSSEYYFNVGEGLLNEDYELTISNGSIDIDNDSGICVYYGNTLNLNTVTFVNNCCAVAGLGGSIFVNGTKVTSDTANIAFY